VCKTRSSFKVPSLYVRLAASQILAHLAGIVSRRISWEAIELSYTCAYRHKVLGELTWRVGPVPTGSPSSDAAASHDATVLLIRPLGEDVWHSAAPPKLGRGWRPQGCGGGGEGRGSLEIGAGFPPPAYWRLFCSHGQRKREGVEKSTLTGLHAPSTK
jgi:hypothetical protein